MTSLELFQKTYGQELAKAVQNPAIQAALQLLNMRKLETISGLSEKDISEHSKEILADLRGHLRHEYDLMNLHREKEFKLSEEGAPIYISPEQEAEEEALIEKHRKERAKHGS